MGRSVVWLLAFSVLLLACSSESKTINESNSVQEDIPNTYIQVLGVAQDAGYPQIGCAKACCEKAHGNKALQQNVVSLGLVDKKQGTSYLFDASPDLPEQLHLLNTKAGFSANKLPDGIFPTHAHMGHYTGLMYLGREAFGAQDVPVYARPRMKTFLENNGPWSQLVELGNIDLKEARTIDFTVLAESNATLEETTAGVLALPVPHRDEFSETVGYFIQGQNNASLYIPDIDKWEKWPEITDWIQKVDYAFLDATFFNGDELPGRDMSEIPHPSLEESMAYFKDLPPEEKAKIYFIHFNHTNPLLKEGSEAQKTVLQNGFNIAKEGQIFPL